MTVLRTLLFITIISLTFCLGCGTLGGFKPWTFTTSKRNLVNAIDTLFNKYPQYKIPTKWKLQDDWKERGYDFLDSRIFYFKSQPEEMYYVTFLGSLNNSAQSDTNTTTISVRAIDNGNGRWTLENETSSSEKKRIENRFQAEIISKLEEYTRTITTRDH